MKKGTYLGTGFIILGMFYLIFPQVAFAYLDPGTGSYILQMLIAGILGAFFMIKIFWNKIKFFFVNFFSKQKSAETDNN